MAKPALLNIEIVAQAKEALSEFDKIKEKTGQTHTAIKAGAAIAAGAVVAFLGEATKTAAEHETLVAKLSQTYKNAGVSTKGMGEALEEIEARSRRTGQSAEDNIAAYTKLVAATHDTEKAHKELAVAEDLAAFKGISVSDAAAVVTKVSMGNTRALKEMGIATKDAGGHALSSAALLDKLAASVKGQANAAGNTAVGQMHRYSESMEQAKEKVGEALLPAISRLIGMLQPLFNWLSRNTGIIRTLVPIVAIAAGVVIGLSAALRVWAAVQAVVNAVMSANPIGLVILAIAGLIAGIVLLVRHWADVVTWLGSVWGVFRSFGAWVAAHWRVIITIILGPLGLVIANFQTIYNTIMIVIRALASVGDAVSKAMSWLGKLPKSAGSILSKLNPFSLPGGGGGAAPTPVIISITATPGDSLPEVVYDALKAYQRRHVRPELVGLFR